MWTTRDIETKLKIPRQTQIDLRASGKFIPHFFAGHRVFYRKEAALRWIQEQEAKAAAEVGGATDEAKAEMEGGGPPARETANHHQNNNPHPHDQAADGVQSNGDQGQGASPGSSFFVTGGVDRSDELLEWYAEDDPDGRRR